MARCATNYYMDTMCHSCECELMNISLTTRLSDGLDVPFIYHINSWEQGLELIQEALQQGADLREVEIK